MTQVQLSILVLGFMLLPQVGFAVGGHVGGGDQCKNEIDRDRVALQGWIQRDEAKDLDFSKARVPGLTYDEYKRRMLFYLSEEKVIVTCYLDPARISDPAAKKIVEDEGVSYKAITIGNPPKPTTCINYEDENNVSHIDCNYDLVMASSSIGNPDYVTTHHEFASIAGIEERTDSFVSDLSVSNQVSQYEHLESRWVLGPKRSPLAESYNCNSREIVTYGRLIQSLRKSPSHWEGLAYGRLGYQANEIESRLENVIKIISLSFGPNDPVILTLEQIYKCPVVLYSNQNVRDRGCANAAIDAAQGLLGAKNCEP